MNTLATGQRAPAPTALLNPGAPLWLATLIACLASFMVVMDGAIVNVALPSMARDLGLDAGSRQWVVDAYLVALGGLMLLAARLADRLGRRRVLRAGLALFSLASLVGGLAQGPALLVAARAFQGAGAAVLTTSTLAVIVGAHGPGAGRDRAIALWTASGSLAAAFGVLLGGLLTAYASWRWVMFVNVPLGIGLFVLASSTLAPGLPTNHKPLDVGGALTVTGAASAMVYALVSSVGLGWGAPRVLLALGLAALLGVAFLIIEARVREPLVRLGLFRQRNVALGNLLLLSLGATLTASLYFLALALHEVAGLGARDTGLAMLPTCLAIASAALGARWLAAKGIRQLSSLGGVLAALGFLGLAWLPKEVDLLRHVAGPTLLLGTGVGLMLATAVHAAIAGIAPADTALASGLLNTSRQLGGALGIAVFVSLAHHTSAQALATGLDAGAATLAGYHAAFVAIAGVSLLTALLALGLRRAG